MKKKGFTIAEVLITLGIVGVVAALTIPGITESSQKKVYASSLSAAVSDLENAMTSMLMREGRDMLQITPAWTGVLDDGGSTTFEAELKKAMPYETSGIGALARQSLKGGAGTEFSGTYKFFANNNALYGLELNTDKSALKEGEIMYKGGALTSVAAEVFIDVNGPNKPNVWGRDTFRYVLGSDGHLYPYGGKDWAIYSNKTYTSTTAKTECVTNKNGAYCAVYLAENGYNMDY